jgi:SAM-dependent methyltransferase
MDKEIDKNEHSDNENILFYNDLANTYDSILEQTGSNKTVRQKVAEKFCSTVKSGWVMDFGGGTGLDLKWLTDNNYKIFFCEPSFQMRQQAVNYNDNILHSSNIRFLDDTKTDFKTWNNKLPFSEKLNGILSNFAVFNNIYDLELLFKNLALVLNPGADIITLVLINSVKKNLRTNFLKALISLVFKKPFIFYVRNKALKQIVYLHSVKQIKKASNKYFNFCSCEPLTKSGFLLIHLVKK